MLQSSSKVHDESVQEPLTSISSNGKQTPEQDGESAETKQNSESALQSLSELHAPIAQPVTWKTPSLVVIKKSLEFMNGFVIVLVLVLLSSSSISIEMHKPLQRVPSWACEQNSKGSMQSRLTEHVFIIQELRASKVVVVAHVPLQGTLLLKSRQNSFPVLHSESELHERSGHAEGIEISCLSWLTVDASPLQKPPHSSPTRFRHVLFSLPQSTSVVHRPAPQASSWRAGTQVPEQAVVML
jgi:hypothetical protein